MTKRFDDNAVCYSETDIIAALDFLDRQAEELQMPLVICFGLGTNLGAHSGNNTLERYMDLLALKEPPMRILFLLARQFNLLLQVKELLAEHCDQATIAKRTGLQSFVVRNYIPMSRQYAAEELKAVVNDCVQMEEDVKTGKISDLLSVELLITKYSRAA